MLEVSTWACVQQSRESEDSNPPQPPHMFTPVKHYDLS